MDNRHEDIRGLHNCFSQLDVQEDKNYRIGLGTKFTMICCNDKCVSRADNNGFLSSEKCGQYFQINRVSALPCRIAGKGRVGLEKICSTLGLSSPVTQKTFTKYTQFWEKLSTNVLEENLEMTRKTAKRVTENELELGKQSVVDVATSFDGSWSSRGWVAKKCVVTTISNKTSQIMDVVLKNSSCHQCTNMAEKQKSGKCTRMEYLDWFVKHDECLQNHDGSSQVTGLCIEKSQNCSK